MSVWQGFSFLSFPSWWRSVYRCFLQMSPSGGSLLLMAFLSPASFLPSEIFPFPSSEFFAAVLSLMPASWIPCVWLSFAPSSSLHLQCGKKTDCSFPDLLSKLLFGKCFQYSIIVSAFLKINSWVFKRRKKYIHAYVK